MRRHLFIVVAASLLLSGCAVVDELRGMSPGVTAADEQLLFLDRLGAASPEELEAIGERLDGHDADELWRYPVDSLRYALWQSTPGHAGYAPEQAARRLNALLEDSFPPRELQALIRIRLRHLHRVQAQAALKEKPRAALEVENAQLRAANDRQQQTIESLKSKIRALTTLERRMGSAPGVPPEAPSGEPEQP